MAFRAEFYQALRLIAAASKKLQEAGLSAPIIVGGSAVEFYTGGSEQSGDFDLVTPHDQPMADALMELGFKRPEGRGALLRGLVHPELCIGVEFVSGQLMDGKADHAKIRVVTVQEGEEVAIIPVEDLIADRLGQAYATQPPRQDMLDQAVKLLQLAQGVDRDYLDRRIKEETVGEAAGLLVRSLEDEY